ncbi:MAG: hypothetical protein M1820_005537 [Bogoriella megaspora]|nr:MAG: hypothetical protein M1820_005537 [Bogoriella megaspora]
MVSENQQKPQEGARTLRTITLLLPVPTLGLSLPLMICFGQPAPFLGFFPQAVSAVLALHLLGHLRTTGNYRDYRIRLGDDGNQDEETPRKPNTSLVTTVLDASIAITVLVFLIITWATIDDWRSDAGQNWLGAYATVPLLASFFIHLWFALSKALQWLIESKKNGALIACPHCQHSLLPHGQDHASAPTQHSENLPPVNSDKETPLPTQSV